MPKKKLIRTPSSSSSSVDRSISQKSRIKQIKKARSKSLHKRNKDKENNRESNKDSFVVTKKSNKHKKRESDSLA